MNKRIVLASRSPRRQELLTMLGWEFDIISPDVDEDVSLIASHPREIPEILSVKKAEYVYSVHQPENAVVIAADTLVILNDEVLGKPADEAEAEKMIKSLSGQTHEVVTGVCMRDTQQTISFSEVTHVTFKTLRPEDIGHYISSGHAMDKAGAYGIQDWLGLIGIEGIRGDYYNVMGLPVHRIYDKIKEF